MGSNTPNAAGLINTRVATPPGVAQRLQDQNKYIYTHKTSCTPGANEDDAGWHGVIWGITGDRASPLFPHRGEGSLGAPSTPEAAAPTPQPAPRCCPTPALSFGGFSGEEGQVLPTLQTEEDFGATFPLSPSRAGKGPPPSQPSGAGGATTPPGALPSRGTPAKGGEGGKREAHTPPPAPKAGGPLQARPISPRGARIAAAPLPGERTLPAAAAAPLHPPAPPRPGTPPRWAAHLPPATARRGWAGPFRAADGGAAASPG